MTDTELKSCIGTIEMLRRLAYNIHGVMDVIDADNCEKIIKVLSDISKYKDAYNKGWDDGAKATYEHLKMCEEEQGLCNDAISRQYLLDNCVVDKVTMPYVPISQIQEAPPVNPQEPKTDVLDKIRAEIEEQKECRCFDDDDMCIYRTGLDDALYIIDKYKAESEE